MRAFAPVFLGFLLISGGAGDVHGQLITGRVISRGGPGGVEGAEITLLDSAGAMRALTVSDTTGAFTLSVPDPGSYLLMASRMGFSLVRAEVTVGEKELLDVELEISEEAIPLDPIVVVARRRIRQGTLDEFYDRMARMKQRGSDHVIQMMGRRGLCYPAVYLDGLPLAAPGVGSRNAGEDASVSGLYPFGDGGGGAARPRYSTIQTMDLEGVEIYRGRFEQSDGYWTSDCGAIFLWRKRDWGNPFTVQRLLLAGGLTGMAFLLLSLF